jgi:hypothetical protein
LLLQLPVPLLSSRRDLLSFFVVAVVLPLPAHTQDPVKT